MLGDDLFHGFEDDDDAIKRRRELERLRAQKRAAGEALIAESAAHEAQIRLIDALIFDAQRAGRGGHNAESEGDQIELPDAEIVRLIRDVIAHPTDNKKQRAARLWGSPNANECGRVYKQAAAEGWLKVDNSGTTLLDKGIALQRQQGW